MPARSPAEPPTATSPTRPKTTEVGDPETLYSNAFRTLLGSELVSLVGDRLVMVALVALVYARTGSASSVGVLLLLKALPALTLGGLAGALVDRWNRQWVMVGANSAQGLLVLLVPLARSADGLAVVFAIYLAMSVVNQLFLPARAATIPDLVAPGALMSANSMFGLAFVGALALGPGIGGWVVERFGLDAAFYLDAVTFLVPAIAVGLLRLPQSGRAERNSPLTQDTPRGWDIGVLEGWRQVRRRPEMLTALGATVGAFLAVGVMSVLGIVVAQDSLGLGASGYGVMMSAMGAGMLLGALLLRGGRTGGGPRDHSLAALTGLVLTGATLAALPRVGVLPLAIPLSALLGVGVLVVQVSTQTTLQQVPSHVRGRVLGLAQTATGLAQVLATATTALLVTPLGAGLVLTGTGVLVALGAAVALAARRRSTPSIDDTNGSHS